jgi:hypothetical protein
MSILTYAYVWAEVTKKNDYVSIIQKKNNNKNFLPSLFFFSL